MSSAPKFTRPTVPELDLKSGIQRPRLLTYHESKSARLEREALKVKKENTQREALRLSLAVTISKKQATRAPKSSKKKGKKGKSVKIVEKVKPEMLSPRITKVVPFRDPGEKKKPMSYNMLERLPGFRKSTDEGIDAILAPDSPIGSPIGTPKRGIHKFYPRGSNRAIHLSKKKKGEEAMIKRSKAGALNLQHKMMGDNYVYAAVKAIILELQRDETDLFNVMYRTPSEIELDNIRMYDSAEDSSDEDEFGSSNAVSPLLGGASTNNTKGVISTKKITPKMILKGDSTMIPESTKYNNNTERFMVREVNLRDNRMTDRGICRVLHDICKCAEITDNMSLLDLSENHMRKSSADVLGQVLIKCCNLEKLVLEKAEISNIVMKAMQVGLTEGANTCLLHLNLSRNEILDAGCIIIADILANEDCQLRELDLSWNKIQDKGAVAIFTALMTNKQILKLDVSWNAIGTKTEKTFSVSTALSDMLLNNSSLIHLDLSQNQLSVQDCTIISEGLKQNHSLLGFHMTGNQAQIDTYGYLMPEASPWPLESGHVMSRIIHSKVTGQEKWILRNNCWICGYYREHEFKYVLTLRGIDEIMHAIMNDTAQLAVFEAKRKAMAAKEEAESKKQAAAEAQADPFAAMFASVSIDSQEAQKNANQAKEEEALQAQYAYPTLPSMPLFVDCSVKLCTSFDQWVPEEMVSLRINTQVINAATNMGNIRKSNSPTATMNAQNATGGYTIKTALENKTLYGEDFNRYPYAMKLMDMYRVEASEEDAKAIALDSLQFSLRTRRREHSAATSATSSHHASLREVDGMDAVGINGAGEMEGTTTTTATDDDDNNNNNDDDDGETAVEGGYCVEIVDGIGNVEEMEVTLSTSAEGEGEIEGEREEQSDANFNKHEEEQEEVEVHRLYGLDEKDNDEYRSDPSRPHFNLHRMVPPGVHYFGFRINNGALQFDPFQPHVRTSTLMKLGLSFPKELLELGLPQFLNTTTVHPLSKAEKLRGPPAMYTDIKPRIKNDNMADAKK
jgi:Leucine-rich repeat (LRR) protein